ncbi:MAG: hypothetical protein ACM3NS_09820 [Deltaproteobacteria bacterium]
MHSLRSALAGTTAIALMLGACHTAPPGPNVVTVTAHDFAFEAPAEIPAGLTTFRLVNDGPSIHHVQIIRLEDGKTADDFVAALKAGGPPPQWASLQGGPNPPNVGSSTSATVDLAPGSYAMICFVPGADGVPHVLKGMVHPFKVTGTAPAAVAEPKADLTIKLVEYDFQLSGPLTAGKHTIRVEDTGSQPHEIVFVRLAPGKTPADIAAWAEKPGGPFPGTLEGGVSGIMPGMHAWAEVDLPPGDYALVCFEPDAKDGKPHFAHGMAKVVHVS